MSKSKHPVDIELERLGKTRSWLQAKAKLHHKTLSRVLNDGDTPSGSTIEAICKALDFEVVPDDFFAVPKAARMKRAQAMIGKEVRHA